jgi:hypothetical protein
MMKAVGLGIIVVVHQSMLVVITLAMASPTAKRAAASLRLGARIFWRSPRLPSPARNTDYKSSRLPGTPGYLCDSTWQVN